MLLILYIDNNMYMYILQDSDEDDLPELVDSKAKLEDEEEVNTFLLSFYMLIIYLSLYLSI